jgi:hypothetical protein
MIGVQQMKSDDTNDYESASEAKQRIERSTTADPYSDSTQTADDRLTETVGLEGIA